MRAMAYLVAVIEAEVPPNKVIYVVQCDDDEDSNWEFFSDRHKALRHMVILSLHDKCTNVVMSELIDIDGMYVLQASH